MSELPELEPLEVTPRPAAAPRPPRHVRRAVVAGVAGAVVLSAVAVALDGSSGSEPDRAPVPEADGWSWTGAPEGDEPAPVGWRRGAPGPLRPRQGHVALWTGNALVVWGGDPADDGHGAAYNPATDRWRPIASAPFSARPWPAPVAVWTGFEMLVWGGQETGPAVAAVAGAYDPIADRWRTLARSPLVARAPLAGVWTGAEFVVAGGTADGRRFPSPEAAAYDPAADRWRRLPPMPVILTDAVGLWTGTEVVILGSALGDGNDPLDPEGKPRAAAYDPSSDRWRLLAPPPLSPQATTAVWTDDEIVAWDYNLDAVALDPDLGPRARWYALPDLPLDFTECYPAATTAGDVVFAEHCGQGAVYRPATRTWTRVTHPRRLSAEPVWTGEELLFWVGRYDGSADGLWRFRPPPPRPVGPVPPVLGAKRR